MKVVSPRRARIAVRARQAERGATRFLTRGWAGALVLGIAAAGAVAVPASASASTGGSPVVGHVYVNDNTKGTNTIGAFDRHADGTLTPLAGFSVPGRRCRDRIRASRAGCDTDHPRWPVRDRRRRRQQSSLGAADPP